MSERFFVAGLRQTEQVRRRLRLLGPLAWPAALALTLPSWGLVTLLVGLFAIVQRHPLACAVVGVATATIAFQIARS